MYVCRYISYKIMQLAFRASTRPFDTNRCGSILVLHLQASNSPTAQVNRLPDSSEQINVEFSVTESPQRNVGHQCGEAQVLTLIGSVMLLLFVCGHHLFPESWQSSIKRGGGAITIHTYIGKVRAQSIMGTRILPNR